MKLAFDRVGSGPKRLAILHGIFGRGRNWASIARAIESEEWTIDLVDLRLHGRSRGFAPPHDLEACARDVKALGPFDAVVGHSFGGKVALLAGAPMTWVIDADPSAREPGGDSWRMLELLRSHPGPFATRDEAIDAMLAFGFSRAIATWMATNLEDGRWIFEAADMEALLRDYFARDLWPLVDSRVQFVRALRSDVLDANAVARIRAASLHEIDGGHWLNADAPDALAALLGRSLAGGDSDP